MERRRNTAGSKTMAWICLAFSAALFALLVPLIDLLNYAYWEGGFLATGVIMGMVFIAATGLAIFSYRLFRKE